MINYKVGDLFHDLYLHKDSTVIISHICNDVGAWGSGFVVPLGNVYPQARESYRNWYKYGYDVNSLSKFMLGSSQFIHDYTTDVIIQNMIAQTGFISIKNPKPISYAALDSCLTDLRLIINDLKMYDKKVKLVCPAFGSERAGGDWSKISSIIRRRICHFGFDMDIYCLTQEQSDKLNNEDHH